MSPLNARLKSLFCRNDRGAATCSGPGLWAYCFLLIGVVANTGCETSQSGTAIPTEFSETFIFELIGHGYRAAVLDTSEVVFRDQASWLRFAAKLNPTGNLKETDFENMMIIAVVIPAPSGGYTVAFDSVDREDGEVIVSYTLSTPGLDCMTIAALTQPFAAIAVQRIDGPVRFERTTVRESCSM
jgi:hypothetical protein